MHGFLGLANQAYRDFPTDSVLNLIFASDEKFLPYTAVTLASLLTNLKDPRPVSVYLLTDGTIPPEHRVRFEALRAIRNFSLEEVIVDAGRFADIKTTPGISAATYYRLKMHELLPLDVNRGLYLDSDLTVRKCIGEIYDTDLQGIMFAGVEDSISRQYKAKFNLPPDAPHINAGVALVNLDEMRRSGFSELVDAYIERHRYLITLGDQQIINCACHHKIKYLPLEWNVHGSMFDPKWQRTNDETRNGHSHDVLMRSVNDPAIVHFTLGRRKPWETLAHPRAREWLSYARRTPYRDMIDAHLCAAAANGNPRKKASQRSSLLWHVLGWGKSLVELRKIRVDIDGLRKMVRSEVAMESLGAASELKSILLSRAASLPTSIDVRAALEALPEKSAIMSNVSQKDMDGGYAENIKIAARTSRISFFKDRTPDAIFLLSQRINQPMFWDCIRAAYLYERPLYFVEVALFGGFAAYFDSDATPIERRALGFMIDDMGYYFDARQPSRLERTLNHAGYILSDGEHRRARNAISRICTEGITKYNKYVDGVSYELEPGAVLVVDQKAGDASIEFSGATDQTFNEMLEAAARENSDKPVYFKRHPDSIHRNRDRDSCRNRSLARIKVLPDEVSIGSIIDQCDKIYTVSSQVGFEGLLRNKQVVTFGAPFFSGWGLTDDRMPLARRTARRSIEEVFHAACIQQSIYVDAKLGKVVEIEQNIDNIIQMRADDAARRRRPRPDILRSTGSENALMASAGSALLAR